MDHELELVITGRGKVGDKSDIELFELDAKKRRNPCKESLKMVCPDCEKGMVVVLATKGQIHPYRESTILTHPERYFRKVPCPRCSGSGIAHSCDATALGDQTDNGKAEHMVA